MNRLTFLFFQNALFLCVAINVFAADDISFIKELSPANQTLANGPVLDLIHQALQKNLPEKRIWKKLLHYEANAFQSVVSQIKTADFFLSNDGHQKNDQELVATLAGFFAPAELKDKHPICRFPARLFWLRSQLKDHPAWNQLPVPTCYFYDVYIRNLNAESISFVFSSYYANSPGSAFGHTFFRVNKKTKVGKSKQELLDYGISYAAQITTGNSLLYMINGLTGGFNGSYVSVPYYYKVREYNDYESRDLWAYELNLNETEVAQLINHLWEVGPQLFDYYFFTQNCSYHMLSALEASSDRINLTDKVPLYVIPSDAVKALFEMTNFVRKVEFRPSLRKHFENKWNLLKENEKSDLVSVISQDSIEKLKKITFVDLERKALFYDTLIDYVDLKDPNGIANRTGRWHAVKEILLVNRAEIPVISDDLPIATNDEDRPDRSHPSARASFGIGNGPIEGAAKTRGFFQFRFAFHDLLDNSLGLPQFSQLEFFNFKFQAVDSQLVLDNFSFFNILQLNPLRRIDPQVSWGVDLGVKNLNLCNGDRSCLGAGLQIYGGYAAALDNSLFWWLPFLHYRFGNQFSITPNYLAVGYQLGYLYEFSQSYKVLIKYGKEIPDRYETADSISTQIRYNLSLRHSVELEWQSVQLSRLQDNQLGKVLYHYFF